MLHPTINDACTWQSKTRGSSETSLSSTVSLHRLRNAIKPARAASDTGPLSVNREHRSGDPTHSADQITQPSQRAPFGCALVLCTWVQQPHGGAASSTTHTFRIPRCSWSVSSLLCTGCVWKHETDPGRVQIRHHLCCSFFSVVEEGSKGGGGSFFFLNFLVAEGHHSNTCTWILIHCIPLWGQQPVPWNKLLQTFYLQAYPPTGATRASQRQTETWTLWIQRRSPRHGWTTCLKR